MQIKIHKFLKFGLKISDKQIQIRFNIANSINTYLRLNILPIHNTKPLNKYLLNLQHTEGYFHFNFTFIFYQTTKRIEKSRSLLPA